jgi:hypothetical protein
MSVGFVRFFSDRSWCAIANGHAAPRTGESLMTSYCWTTARMLQPNFRIPLRVEPDIFTGYVFAELKCASPANKRNNLAKNK